MRSYALAQPGFRAASYKHGGASALDGLRKLAPQAAKQTGLAAKFLLAAELAGDAQLAQTMRQAVAAAFAPATGLFAKDATTQALAILAQVTKDVPATPLRALKASSWPMAAGALMARLRPVVIPIRRRWPFKR